MENSMQSDVICTYHTVESVAIAQAYREYGIVDVIGSDEVRQTEPQLGVRVKGYTSDVCGGNTYSNLTDEVCYSAQ
jgi:hypothetical protein